MKASFFTIQLVHYPSSVIKGQDKGERGKNIHINKHSPIVITQPLQTHFLLVEQGPKLRRERFSNLHRLTDTRALDDNVLHLASLGQTGKFSQEVPPECAADTAVLELDEFFLCLRDVVVCD